MQVRKQIAVSFAAFIAMTGSAYAGVQAQCGSLEGFAFAAEQGIVQSGDAGWYEDAITAGEFVIRVDTETLAVDVRFRDATGIWQSVADQGGSATLFAAHADPATFMIIVAYPGTTIEMLTLAEITNESARLIHTTARSTTTITNSRILVGSCVLTRF